MIVLNDGATIPPIGLGTYALSAAQVLSGLKAGYRLLDSALKYGNESEVGAAVRRSGLDRAEIQVTTKLPGRYHGYDKTIEGFEVSLRNLGLDYVDLYLIHWPLPRLDLYVDSWRAMIDLRDQGRVRSIGVSNFTPPQLTRLTAETGVTPAVNQIELHPYFPQAGQRADDEARGIVTQSWSPLAEGRDLGRNEVVAAAARAHGVSAAQVVLRWNTQLGAVPIPRSGDPGRQRQNLDIFGFTLTGDEMKALSTLGRSRRLWGADPDVYESY
ncbi:diketogulonate reductase-like aldo/keto reductase [Actinoplanes tereljensis]|uniref:Oxidoreductase n=1 Tax=Paractinoplanes tereljensis TaxID=571912 RepID=A0A919NTK7_9ACTN|nr:aldo/keto reductase [Actinoplanes tereljensis]GIF23292.1 oxidoreductase [Actinoplanes tereljensis]